MEAKNKKRILLGLIILLVLINLSAIITIGYNKYDRKRDYDEKRVSDKKEDKNPHKRMKLYVKKELELTDNQFSSYCGLKDKNLENVDTFVKKIQHYKKEIIAEINKEVPDSLLLLKLSDSIGTQHMLIQIEMNRHFLAIKTMLEPSQIKKFEKLLNRMDERYRPGRKRKYRNNKEERNKGKENKHRYRGGN